MKSVKKLNSLILFFLVVQSSVAQETSFFDEVWNYFTNVNDKIDSAFQMESKNRIKREVGYLQKDLTKYLDKRKKFMLYMESIDFEIVEDEGASKHVYKLTKRLEKILGRTEKVSYLLNKEREDLFMIKEFEYGQNGFLAKLNMTISGSIPLDKSELKQQTSDIYLTLVHSLDLLNSIENRL